MTSPNIDNINKRLDATHGRNMSDQPLFRIVFSDDEREKRFGHFAEYAGKLFLRDFTGLREVPKYPTIKHQWILERWMPPAVAFTHEIPETVGGSYEPIFVFQDENGAGLPVLESVVQRIIHTLFHPDLPGHRTSELKAQEQIEFDREVEQNRLEIEEQGRTWIGHRLHSGEGVVVK